jgi:hypothetical protein
VVGIGGHTAQIEEAAAALDAADDGGIAEPQRRSIRLGEADRPSLELDPRPTAAADSPDCCG